MARLSLFLALFAALVAGGAAPADALTHGRPAAMARCVQRCSACPLLLARRAREARCCARTRCAGAPSRPAWGAPRSCCRAVAGERLVVVCVHVAATRPAARSAGPPCDAHLPRRDATTPALAALPCTSACNDDTTSIIVDAMP
jgi:hypothetical protein